jgi:iron-sulfur cluster repair protein YtfE (RIC family)
MSHPFVTQLKREHLLIHSLLEEVRKAGIATKLGQAALNKAKHALLTHLKKEDEELYPALREAAKRDSRLSELVRQYNNEMQEVSALAMRFFNTYANGGTGYHFGKDYGALMARLSQRIKNEEMELYAEYERAQKSPGNRAGGL